MRVLVVSEGEHELGEPEGESALVNLVGRLLARETEFTRKTVRDPDVRIHVHAGKADGYERRALAWIRYAEREGFDALVLVIDQDRDDRRHQQLEKAQDNAAFAVGRALGVAMRTFDAWILADEQALTQVLGCRIQRQREPEGIADAKSLCRQLRDENSRADLGLSAFYAAVAAQVDLSLLERRCPKGCQPFAQRVRAL